MEIFYFFFCGKPSKSCVYLTFTALLHSMWPHSELSTVTCGSGLRLDCAALEGPLKAQLTPVAIPLLFCHVQALRFTCC